MNLIHFVAMHPEEARAAFKAALDIVSPPSPPKPPKPPDISLLPEVEGGVMPYFRYYDESKSIKKRREINSWLAIIRSAYAGETSFETVYRGMSRSEAATVERQQYDAVGYYWTRWDMYAAEYAFRFGGYVCKAEFPVSSFVGEDGYRKRVCELIVAPTKAYPNAARIRYYRPIPRIGFIHRLQKRLFGKANYYRLIPVPRGIVRRSGKPITDENRPINQKY